MPNVVDKSTTTELDALMLSRGWRAVAAASGTDKHLPVMYHTVCIEQYEMGLRLTATNAYRLLTTWVPAKGWTSAEAPGMDELPHATAVAVDQWGRAKSLLAYMAQQAAKEENDGLTALVKLGVPWQAPETPKSELQFEGFNALAVDLEYVDNERLQLPVYEGAFLPWRETLNGFKPQRTPALALMPEQVEAISKAVKPFGDSASVDLRFGGTDKPIAIAFGDSPPVHGLLMPALWDYEKNGPADPEAAG